MIKSILSEFTKPEKIYSRDKQSYFAILYEDNNRKWIARLHLNTGKKYLDIHEVKNKKVNTYLKS